MAKKVIFTILFENKILMPRIKLTIEYDGTRYSGWQFQNDVKTIQGELEKALKTICKKHIAVTGSGRTDAGVHARNQIAHCDFPEDLSASLSWKDKLYKLRKSINGLIEKDIVVKDIEISNPEFHARYDAKSRIYRYYISKTPTSINRNFSWYIPYSLDFTLMQTAANDLTQIGDFKAFCKTGSGNKTTFCKVIDSTWNADDESMTYNIEANRFLYGMVRGIVGTLVLLGSIKISYEEYLEIINNQRQQKIKLLAPPNGLFLEQINY